VNLDEELGDVDLLPLFCDLCETDFDAEVITLGEVRVARFLVRYKRHPACGAVHDRDYFYCATHWGLALSRKHTCVSCSLPMTVAEEDPL